MTGSLAAVDLDFGYPGHRVGSRVSLALRAGEVVCLLGPNGGGKTTFFKTLIGLIPRQGGRVELGGSDLDRLPRAEIARRIAYVPQAQVGYFPYSVHEIATMGRTAHLSPFAGPRNVDRAIALTALERVGLARLAAQPFTRVSGGERQLTLIARALAQDAPLIVMDEPTASLDFGNQLRVLEVVRDLAAAGTGLLIATHDPDHALLVADRVALFHDGRLVADAPPAQALTPAHLREVYGVEVELQDVTLAGGTRRRICVPTGRVRPA
jgi:iron complex transport system ATP-binding protein